MLKNYFVYIIILFLPAFISFAEFSDWQLKSEEVTVSSSNTVINIRIPAWNIDHDIECQNIICDKSIDWCFSTNQNIYLSWIEKKIDDNHSINAALFDKAGTLIWHKVVYEFKAILKDLHCITLADNNLFMIWQAYNIKMKTTNLWSFLVSDNGIPLWKTPFPINTKSGNQSGIRLGYDHNKNVIVFWQEKNDKGLDIMYQRFDEKGLTAGIEDGILLANLGVTGFYAHKHEEHHKVFDKIILNTYNNNSKQATKIEINTTDLPIPEPKGWLLSCFLFFCYKILGNRNKLLTK